MSAKKPLIIYHDNCADGFGAAWAAYRKFGEDGAEYLAMNYNDSRVSVAHDELTFPADVADRDVYILDFSFSREVMGLLAVASASLTWLDHHKTAFEQYELDPSVRHESEDGPVKVTLDPDKSGCMLAWELFHPTVPMPWMLQLIGNRDLGSLWREDMTSLPGCREFSMALRSEPFSFGYFNRVNRNLGGFIEAGEAMCRLYDQQLADITKRPTNVRLGTTSPDWLGLSVNCTPQFASEAGHALARLSSTFGMTWYAGDEGEVFVSLRSIGDFDVSALAKLFGGGGHRNAAGFQTTLDKLQFNDQGVLEIHP